MTGAREPIRLAISQKARAGRMLARAFLDDPIYTALFPERPRRERVLQQLFDAVVGYSLVYGLVHTTPAVDGAACWLSPGKWEITFWRMLRTGIALQRAMARFTPQARREFLVGEAFMDEIHRRQVPGPHWYLWALGVEPGCQGQGIGSRLIQPGLVQADRDRVPCYVESLTEENVAFYEKQGFEVLSRSIVPGQGMPVWGMLRVAHR